MNNENKKEKEFYTNSIIINFTNFDVELKNQLVNSNLDLTKSLNIRMSLVIVPK